jgi:hypothetical protein
VSTLFHVVRFPHQGKVITVDQLAFFNSDTRTGNIPFIAKTPPGYENVGVGLLKDSSLMGTFPIPPPDVPHSSVASINMISTSIHETPVSHDPWMVPDPGDHLHYGDEMPLSLVESAYQAIQSATPSTPSLGELSPDPFCVIFPIDEMIMFVMEDTPWDDGHHHSILFLEQHTIENYQWISTLLTIVVISTIPESTHDVFSEGNLSNISPTIPLNISIKPGIVEKMCIYGASMKKCCSQDMTLKIVQSGYTSLFKEFQGSIRVCVDYRDINKACPKDNFPTPFID